jgi:trimeric autotransporter adhesin
MKHTAILLDVILPRLGSREGTIHLAALLVLGLAGSAWAQGTTLSYQGRVLAHGTNFTGTGQFKFALVTSTNHAHQATAAANLTGPFVTSYNVTYGGSGYVTAPAVHLSGGGGSGATATALISGGVVTAINPASAGSGYTIPPTVTIDPPPQNTVYVTYWSNDGTSAAGSEPAAAVSVSVSDGLFTVILGDPSLANMVTLDADVFLQSHLQLRMWFSDSLDGFAALHPAQDLTSAPYAAFANTASNLIGTLPVSQLSGAVPNSQLAYSSVTVNAGAGLVGGGSVMLGGTVTLNNTGVLSVTGNADITASTVNGLVTLGDNATSSNTPSTLIKRDASGNFAAGIITANLAGNADTVTHGIYDTGTYADPYWISSLAGAKITGDLSGKAAGFTGSLAGDVTGPQAATVVSSVGGQSAASIASGSGMANAATTVNTPNTLIKRDGSGGFAAGSIAAATVSGDGSGLTALNAGQLSSGTLSDGRLSLNVPLLNKPNIWTGRQAFQDGIGDGNPLICYGDFTILGSNLSLPATSAAAGIIYSGGGTLMHSYGSGNFFAGQTAGNLSLSGEDNTGVGVNTLHSNMSGSNNTAVGFQALQANTNGYQNTAIGNQALAANTTGYGNTAIGDQALYYNMVGNYNTANGANALYSNTSGFNNTAYGVNALYSNRTGRNNTAIGNGALRSNTNGTINTAFGNSALAENTSGSVNTAIGDAALYWNTSGGHNIALGPFAGFNLSAGDNNIYIGNEGKAVENGVIRIGTQGSHTNSFIAGIYSQTVTNGSAVYVDSSGQLGTLGGSGTFSGDGSGLTNLAATNLVGTVPPASLPSGAVVKSLNGLQDAVNLVAGSNISLATSGNQLQISAVGGASDGWSLTGNASTTAGLNFIGTTDNQPLELKSHNQRVFRLEATPSGAPNVIGGWVGNSAAGSQGSTISGGGTPLAVIRIWDETNVLGRDISYSNRPNAVVPDPFVGVPNFATIGGGIGNTITALADLSTIAGGADNFIRSSYSFPVPGGFSVIGGGRENEVHGTDCVISGGRQNQIIESTLSATIGGGCNNYMWRSSLSTIGGGSANLIGAYTQGSTISGGVDNRIGHWSAGNADYCAIGGGTRNVILPAATLNTISGGNGNWIREQVVNSTISGGLSNQMMVRATNCAIGGGCSNLVWGASNAATIGGGHSNTVRGFSSTVPGGRENYAGADYSFAAGRRAKAQNSGVFVWADSTDADFASTGNDQFLIRATGGVGIQNTNPIAQLDVRGNASVGGAFTPNSLNSSNVLNLQVGVSTNGCANGITFCEDGDGTGMKLGYDGTGLGTENKLIIYDVENVPRFVFNSGGNLGLGVLNPTHPIEFSSGAYLDQNGVQHLSDVNRKTDFRLVSSAGILESLARLPVRSWRYTNEVSGVRHLGPTAQDFKAAFELGADDRTIGTVDADGVALAAIQGLNEVVKQKEVRIEALEKNVAELKALVDRLIQKENGGGL